ncbi:hypothetical protein ACJ3XI_10905 [Litorimonas sp. RW-G-Af-16]|uniref:hypothetical protein n=1 Tax=Litorimonas sp. RW-G-Af-16 TaxID=3241168 RepID=UPI00390C9438
MSKLIQLIVWGGALFISAIFVDSLRFKFSGHETPKHIFETLKDWSGIGLFYPAGPWIIGLAELFAAILLIVLPLIFLLSKNKRLLRLSQALGALLALGVMSGAIVFHLFTPLGIATPVEWVNGEPTKFSNALFISACVSWGFALFILLYRRKELRADALQFS